MAGSNFLETHKDFPDCVYCSKTILSSSLYLYFVGTGTPIVDPIETKAIGDIIGACKKENGLPPLNIGSVKPNFGHPEAAAGVASLIKVLLMMKHKEIVPSVIFEPLSDRIDFDKLHIKLVQTVMQWPDYDLIAGINSFGYGGSNTYAVVKHWSEEKKSYYPSNRKTEIITLSAPQKGQLEKTVKKTVEDLNPANKIPVSESNILLSHVSYTTTVRRSHFKNRVAVIAASREELADKLVKAHVTQTKKKGNFQTIFVFNGMGTYWKGMCKELLLVEPVFEQTIKEVDACLKQFVPWSLESLLSESVEFTETSVVQPAIFACQLGLARLWIHWGIQPEVVLGHSVGEVAAAHIAGYLTLEQAVEIVHHRGRLLSQVKGGKMLAVGNISVAKVEQIKQKYNNRISVAAYNSSTSCTLSGDSDAVNSIEKDLQKEEDNENAFLKMLDVNTAFHSHHVKPILEELKQKLNGLKKISEPCYTLVSTVTGKRASCTDYITPEYWSNNVHQPVLFERSLQLALDKDKTSIIFEIGPKPALKNNMQEILGTRNFIHLTSMRKNSEMYCMQTSLCEAYRNGLQIIWENYHKFQANKLSASPKIVMENHMNYFEPDSWTRKKNGMDEVNKAHMFVSPADYSGLQFNVEISKGTTPFVFHHRSWNQILVPGATYVEIATACMMMLPQAKYMLKQVSASVFFHKKLELHHGEKIKLVAKVRETNNKYEIDVKQGEAMHASAIAYIKEITADVRQINPEEIKLRTSNHFEQSEFYQILESAHFRYGKTLTVVKSSHASDNESISFLEVSPDILHEDKKSFFHPAAIDGMMQGTVVFDVMKVSSSTSSFMIPVAVEGIRIYGSVEPKMVVHLVLKTNTDSERILSGTISNQYGTVLLTCSRIRLVSISEETSMGQVKYHEIWEDQTTYFLNKCYQRPKQSKYLIVASNHEHSQLLQQQICEITQNESHIVTAAEGDFLRALQNFEKTEISTGAVIYLQTTMFDCAMDSHTIEELIYKRCNTVADILKGLQNSESIPLYVVTARARIKSGSINLADYAIWGFVRSAIMESSVAVTLVDVENTEVHVIKHLANFISRLVPSNPEWIIQSENATNAQFLCNYIVKAVEQGESTREHQIDRTANLSLQSGRADILNDLKYFYQTNLQALQEGVKMKLSLAVLPVGHRYPVTTTGLENGLSKMDDGQFQGHPLLILNSLGHNEGSTREKAILYPHACQSVVNIPKECITDSHSLPKGSKLILSQLFIVYEVLQKLARFKHDQILLLKEGDNNLDLVDIATKFLSAHYLDKFKVKLFNGNIRKSHYKNATLLLLHDPSIPSQIKDIIETKSSVIVVIDQLVGMNTILYLRHMGLTVDSIQMSNIFSPTYLKRTTPLFFKWLKRRTDFPKIETYPPTVPLSLSLLESSNAVKERDETLAPSLPVNIIVTKETLFRHNAKYILIGGLYGLGWVLAEYMARHNAGILVGVSRSPPSSEKILEISNLERETGVEIVWAECDVRSFEKTKAMLTKVRQYRNEFPIKGIFHSAVVYADRLFMQMTKDEFLISTGPKVLGAWNLHLLTKVDNLDYFLLHSSGAAVMGNAGQTNYSASNGFLDGLAVYRRQMGLVGQTIRWGPLHAGIIERNYTTEEILRSQGFLLLQKDIIRKCFEHALLSNKIHTFFINADLGSIAETFEVHRTKSEGFVHNDRLYGPRIGERLKHVLLPFASESLSAQDTVNQGRPMKPEQQRDVVMSVVASVLGLPETDIDTSTPLMEMGMNSMHAVVLRNQMKKSLGTRITVEHLLHPQMNVESLLTFPTDSSFSDVELNNPVKAEPSHPIKTEPLLTESKYPMPASTLSAHNGPTETKNPSVPNGKDNGKYTVSYI